MPPTVYVVAYGIGTELDEIKGVYATLEGAQSSVPGVKPWVNDDSGDWVKMLDTFVYANISEHAVRR